MKSVYEVGYSAYPLGTAHRGFGSEMHMALDGQGRSQIGLGKGGRRAAPAVEAARAMYVAVFRSFILLRIVYLQFLEFLFGRLKTVGPEVGSDTIYTNKDKYTPTSRGNVFASPI